MKLNYEDKVHIYELRKQGATWAQLSEKYGVVTSNLK
ncbi:MULTISPECIES: fucose isomerase [Streptococcus]|nr:MULTISPECIES: fucose isomerase [Streptococcus]